MKQVTNVPASIHARLMARAHDRREDFNLTLQRYVVERFLYRLGASSHRAMFILKGAMLLPLWGGDLYRATKDLDLTGYARDNAESLVEIVREICEVLCPDDGLEFLSRSVKAEPIRDQGEYHGFRVKLQARLGNARLPLQVDIGLGDAVEALDGEYPTLLDGKPPLIRSYPREAVIAEKLHAMVVLGAANTRYKDFYDAFTLARRFRFEGPVLGRALAATFARRSSASIAERPMALTSAFYEDPKRQAEWSRYLTRSTLAGSSAPTEFAEAGIVVVTFLGPLWDALVDGRTMEGSWTPDAGWGESSGEAGG